MRASEIYDAQGARCVTCARKYLISSNRTGTPFFCDTDFVCEGMKNEMLFFKFDSNLGVGMLKLLK